MFLDFDPETFKLLSCNTLYSLGTKIRNNQDQDQYLLQILANFIFSVRDMSNKIYRIFWFCTNSFEKIYFIDICMIILSDKMYCCRKLFNWKCIQLTCFYCQVELLYWLMYFINNLLKLLKHYQAINSLLLPIVNMCFNTTHYLVLWF